MFFCFKQKRGSYMGGGLTGDPNLFILHDGYI